MESIGGVEVRSVIRGANPEDVGVGLEFLLDAQRLTPATQPGTGSSFTALLELPATRAMELLHSSQPDEAPSSKLSPGEDWIEQNPEPYNSIPVFPWNTPLVDHPSKFHGVVLTDYLPESSSRPSSNFQKVKQEPVDSDSSHNSSPDESDPMLASPNQQKSAKRKEGERKVKGSNKKSKSSANETSEDGEKLPYVHFRARRGQATNSHSLAERARREKINARMKLLQELVPGCNKISGTAMVLDEIINHVQSLQRQVEILSMRLAAVNPKIDFSLNSLLAEESGFLMDGSFLGMTVPSAWPEGQVNWQQHEQLWHFDELHHPVWNGEEDKPSFITPENSILSYQTFANCD